MPTWKAYLITPSCSDSTYFVVWTAFCAMLGIGFQGVSEMLSRLMGVIDTRLIPQEGRVSQSPVAESTIDDDTDALLGKKRQMESTSVGHESSRRCKKVASQDLTPLRSDKKMPSQTINIIDDDSPTAANAALTAHLTTTTRTISSLPSLWVGSLRRVTFKV